MAQVKPEDFEIFKNICFLNRASGEYALANIVAINLRNLSFEGKLSGVWFHVPNEFAINSPSDIVALRKRHGIGMMNGAPDFVFLKNTESLQVELKTQTGKLSESQKKWQAYSERKGVPYVVARSWDEVELALKKYGFIKC
jgi:hypothetical protein